MTKSLKPPHVNDESVKTIVPYESVKDMFVGDTTVPLLTMEDLTKDAPRKGDRIVLS